MVAIRSVLMGGLFAGLVGSAVGGVLEDYVKKEDGALRFDVTNEFNLGGVKVLNVRLISQSWQGMEWKHWLSVVVPPEIDAHKKAILMIGGGKNSDEVPTAPAREAMMLGTAAAQLKVPLAVLQQVPNQPLFDDLYEDDLIAYTFDRYLKGEGDDWPLLLPMVKSATRAMDAVQGLAKQGKLGEGTEVESFVVGGASKRGWTTWLTSSVDARVSAAFPMVIDVLNMHEQMERQMKTYGKFSDMIEPYTKRGVQDRMHTPAGKVLNSIVDPYSYLEKITQPKLVLLGTNDPYWTADAAQLYFADLEGRSSMFYLPNAGHGLGFGIVPTVTAFFDSQMKGWDFPVLKSSREGDVVKVSWEGQGKGSARVYRASSEDRDFREQEWVATAVGGEESCEFKLETPEKGWAAAYVSVKFERQGVQSFEVSIPITVTPETFPHVMPEEKL